MKQSRFTDSQIMAILKQAEAGTPVPELCREHGMSSASFYKWRAKYVSVRPTHLEPESCS
ncbi:transposase [Eoetvoesiella caeni]|uniref:Transposase n=1 Tax=Eoetvoesiella caeni TaxID=645616 RepID=A0A366HIJ8_9BURK|nr:transposase [Eoetvoesiella caeni]